MDPASLRALEALAPGPHPRAFRGLDPFGQPVLLKRFSLATAVSWKAYELFEREARLLQQLVHPQLPRLLAYGEDAEGIYLISSWISGTSLAQRLEAGQRFDEAALIGLARQLLELLDWLHTRQPPIVHRDIKPANLILAEDGSLSLIDFGSVLLRLNPDGGSTVAGTFGYMAPEQLSGRASPASDLYGVGATLVHLLSGRAPAELPQERLRIAFEPYVSCSPRLKRWLQRLLAPAPEDRYASAAEALRALGGERPPAPAPTELRLADPPGPLDVTQTPAGIALQLPPRPHLHLWGRRRLPGAGLLLLGVWLHPLLPLLATGLAADGLYDGWRLLRLGCGVELRLDAHHLWLRPYRTGLQLPALEIVRADVLEVRLRSTRLGLLLELVHLDGFGTRRLRPLALQPDPAEAAWLIGLIAAWRNGPEGSLPRLA